MEDKELKLFFFICNWFDSNHRIRSNKYGMDEIKHNAKSSLPVCSWVALYLKGREPFIDCEAVR
jgi:hypothetical protein